MTGLILALHVMWSDVHTCTSDHMCTPAYGAALPKRTCKTPYDANITKHHVHTPYYTSYMDISLDNLLFFFLPLLHALSFLSSLKQQMMKHNK